MEVYRAGALSFREDETLGKSKSPGGKRTVCQKGGRTPGKKVYEAKERGSVLTPGSQRLRVGHENGIYERVLVAGRRGGQGQTC